MPTFVSHVCAFCKTSFDVSLKDHNRGGGKFCSRKCVAASLTKHKTDNATCSLCHSPFHATKTRKQSSKSNFLFCSRACKNKAQAIGSGFDSMLPSHYGSSNSGNSSTYRRIAFENHPNCCFDCQWNQYLDVLDVHHIDSDRTNNHPDNLMILCPTCHTVRHFLAKNGRYLGKNRYSPD